MTDNGRAALTTALQRASFYPYRSGVDYGAGRPIEWEFLREQERAALLADAAAILGEHGVFLPEGLPEIVENMEDAYHEALALRGATIATLRAALDGLVADFVDEDPDLPDDYPIEWEMTLGSLRSAALANAKETP